jgi:hypothetical protein
MAGKHEALKLGVLAALLVACDGFISEPQDPEQIVVLHVVGMVTSEPGGQPVEGATVDLGWGGHFSLPTARVTSITDARGRYEISDTLEYGKRCPFLWMRASATGYSQLWNYRDDRVSVSCVPWMQIINIPLEPET